MTQLESEELIVSVQSPSTAGNLTVQRKDLPGNQLDFRTCEGVLEQNRDFGLFAMHLTAADWKLSGNSLSYTWLYPEQLQVDFSVAARQDYLELLYTVRNHSSRDLSRVQIHPCIPTTHAPVFRPSCDSYSGEYQPKYFDRRGPAMVPCEKTYFELFDRIRLWNNGEPFTLRQTSGGNSEVHLSVMKEKEPPLEWAWWNNARETFDLPFLTVSDKTDCHTIALSFSDSIWASSNVGDERACFHLFPYFGSLAPGSSATVSGTLAFIAGSAREAFDRFTPGTARSGQRI